MARFAVAAAIVALLAITAAAQSPMPAPKMAPLPAPPARSPVATPPTAADAELLRTTLEDNGIRATVATTDEGPRLMVFRADETTARRLVAG
jgi:hypothetical protein